MGIKKGLMLSNTVGIIDASYYENEGNDGNIGLPLLNTSGRGMEIKRGDRICQGIFVPYLLTDEDKPLHEARIGGFGSSGE
jgi:dUTP pyrophosphatase